MGSWVYQPQSGPPGPPGADGADSIVPGPPGPDGADGKSAYEIAKENGFPGTEQEWLDSLKGEPGEPGDDGIIAATPYEQIEPVGPTLELSDATFGHLLPNTAHFDQIEMFPVGMIISWVGDYGQVPNGWLLCHGQNLTGYETDLLRLYQIMPDYHGVGYFHTPDFRGRSPVGVNESMTLGGPMFHTITLGQRFGDQRIPWHRHGLPMSGTGGMASLGGGDTGGDPQSTAAVTGNVTAWTNPAEEPKINGAGHNMSPLTGVNFLIYCGQDTFAIKDRDDLGNVDVVTTRSMIEARLAEAGIGEEEIKILKEQLEELKRTEAK